MKNSITFFPLILIIFISGCSIEKRHYMKGYNIQWNSKANDKSQSMAIIESVMPQERSNITDNLSASADTEIVPISLEKVRINSLKKECINLCSTAKRVNKIKTETITEKKTINESLKNVKDCERKSLFKTKNINKTNVKVKNRSWDAEEYATSSLIFGFLSILFFIFCGIFSIIAIIQCSIALCLMSENPNDKSFKGRAIIGIVFGVISLLLFLMALSLIFMSLTPVVF